MRNAVPVMVLLIFYACGSRDGSEGGLGQVFFSTDCGLSDSQCLITGLNTPLAVGSKLPLVMDSAVFGSAAFEFSLVSSNPEVLSVSGLELQAKSKGLAALVVLASNEQLLDFIHLWVENPDGLSIRRISEEGSIIGEIDSVVQMLMGQEIILDTRMMAGDQVLQGLLDVDWSSDSQVVTLLSEGVSSRVRVVARKEGQAMILAQSGESSKEMIVEVLP